MLLASLMKIKDLQNSFNLNSAIQSICRALMSPVTWRTMLRTPWVPWKIFILTQKLFQEWVMPFNSQESKQIFLSAIILIEITQLCWKQWKWMRHIYEVRTLQCLESLRSFIFLVWFKVPVILPWSSGCFTKHPLVSEKRFFLWRAIKKIVILYVGWLFLTG